MYQGGTFQARVYAGKLWLLLGTMEMEMEMEREMEMEMETEMEIGMETEMEMHLALYNLGIQTF